MGNECDDFLRKWVNANRTEMMELFDREIEVLHNMQGYCYYHVSDSDVGW